MIANRCYSRNLKISGGYGSLLRFARCASGKIARQPQSKRQAADG